MHEMQHASIALGGFRPGSESQFMSPSLTPPIHGTTRIGDAPQTNVIDVNSKIAVLKTFMLG
jgi:hypothetical protein